MAQKTEKTDSQENVMGVTLWAAGILAVVLIAAWMAGLL